MELCCKYSIHIISDEIYALSVFGSKHPVASNGDSAGYCPFTSVCLLQTLAVIDLVLVHVVCDLSKDFGADDSRLGCIMSQNSAELHRALVAPVFYSYVSSASELIAARLLNDYQFTDWYIAENCRRLHEKYEKASIWARSHNIAYKEGVHAAFFLWVNLGVAFVRSQVTSKKKESLPCFQKRG